MSLPIEVVRRIRDGEVVEVEGFSLKKDGDGVVRDGDLYVAGRNTGPHLLIARKVDQTIGCVFPTTHYDYPFDIGECVRVIEAERE